MGCEKGVFLVVSRTENDDVGLDGLLAHALPFGPVVVLEGDDALGRNGLGPGRQVDVPAACVFEGRADERGADPRKEGGRGRGGLEMFVGVRDVGGGVGRFVEEDYMSVSTILVARGGCKKENVLRLT